MKKMLLKLHKHELFTNFITFTFFIAISGCFLVSLIIKIAVSPAISTLDARPVVVAAAGIFIVLIMAGISFYRHSASYIRWYKAVLDSIPMPVIVTDKNARWLRVNKAAREVMALGRIDNLNELNSHHLLNADGCIMGKTWMNNGVAYRVTGDRLYYDKKSEGYLILLDRTSEIPDARKTRTELIDEINKLLGQMSTATDQFHDCASSLAGCNVWQAGVISDLTDVIAEIASGELKEPDALNKKMVSFKTDMQQHAKNSQANLEAVEQTVAKLNAARDCIDDVLHNMDNSL